MTELSPARQGDLDLLVRSRRHRRELEDLFSRLKRDGVLVGQDRADFGYAIRLLEEFEGRVLVRFSPGEMPPIAKDVRMFAETPKPKVKRRRKTKELPLFAEATP